MDAASYPTVPQVPPGQTFLSVDTRSFPPGQLWRYTIDTRTGQVERVMLQERNGDFPTLNPAYVGRPYRYVYLVAAPADQPRSFAQTILKLDLETGATEDWSAEPYGFPGEALFVPRSGTNAEDDGWLLSLVYDSNHHRTDLVILDAQRLAQGPVARLHFRLHLPHGFHGQFVKDYFGPQ